ncbi:MAG TPA: nucleotide sugar dehydrogenase [Actinomycetota bacterium]|nr:nucleotide sugar dehydrogenase [Actinomycetota bacterium]
MTGSSDDFATVILGGCGRVGLPLGIALASSGVETVLYDVNEASVAKVNSGVMPFDEPGAPEVLKKVIDEGTLLASTDPAVIADARYVVVVLGTPVDEHLNPDPRSIPRALSLCAEHLRDGQIVILRSTIYPGVTAMVERLLDDLGRKMDVAFCPERIAEGKALTELYDLPQIIGASTHEVGQRAEQLFRKLTDKIIHVKPEEAELAKLFTNSWRYIKFAIANSFYMVSNDFGLDFENIRRAIVLDYPRAADLPAAGFAAGPCLFKDTMQLAAFNNNDFALGHSAMLVNEGLPLYVVAKLEDRFDLSSLTVGILGMAFKAGSDDRRESLSYKLKRILQFKAQKVLCSDPFVKDDPELVVLETVLAEADLLIIGAPHSEYAGLDPQQEVIDIWNLLGRGTRA